MNEELLTKTKQSKYSCAPSNKETRYKCDMGSALAITTLLSLAAALSVIGVAVFMIHAGNSQTRYAITASNGGGCLDVLPGDSDAVVHGWVIVDESSKSVKWELIPQDMAAVKSIEIRGPLTFDSPNTAPIYLELCGVEGLDACDTTDKLTGTLAVDKNGNGLRKALPPIRDSPFYYLKINTDDFPLGAVCARLNVAS